MQTIINKQQDETTIQFVGRMDTPAAQEAATMMDKFQEAASGTVILDCSKLEYISSSGLRIFLSSRKAAAAQGGKVIVQDINDNIRNVFMMTGFLNLFEIR